MATRLYFHDATNSLANLPTTEQSSLTATVSVDAATINLKMDTDIGVGPQVQKRAVTGTTAAPTLYFTRFVSDELGSSQTSIAANTWTYNFAIRESAAGANFPVTTSGATCAVCYVWRPSTQSVVGTIIDSATGTASINEATTGITNRHTTFSGSSVASTQAGDVIVFEVWFRNGQAAGTSRNDDFFYDGTTVNTTAGSTVTNHASFIETPEDIVWGPKTYTRAPTDTVTVTESLARSRTAQASTPQNFKVGVITKDATSGAHTQNFTNELGFTPQWGIFIMSGKTASGSGAHTQNSIGITDGTNHFCYVRRVIDGNSSATSSVISYRPTDNFTMGLDATVSSSTTISEGRASWGSNGFDIIWDKADTTQNKIIYIIGGGGGFHDAKVTTHQWGSNPWQHTNVGFQGDIVFLLHAGGTIDTLSATASIDIGCAMSSSSRWGVCSSTSSGFASLGARRQRTDRVTVALSNSNSDRGIADFDGFLSNGFDIGTPSGGNAADAMGSLVIKGGLWDIGAFNQNTSNGTQQVNITTGRTPTGLILATFGDAANTSSVTNARLSIGATDGTTEASIWDGFLNGAASSYVARSDFSDTKLIRTLAESSGNQTLQTEADWSAFGSGFFTINNTTTDATSRQICYIAFTSSQVSGNNYQGTPSTDTVSISDASTTRLLTANRAPSTDSPAITDSSLTRMLSATRAPSSDTLTIADVSTTRSATRVRSTSTDSSTITDSALTRILSATRTPSLDTLTIGETPTRMLSANRLPSTDSTTVADVSIIAGKVYDRDPAVDTITIADVAITRLLSARRSPSLDTIISGESLIRILSALRVPGSDTTTVADAAIDRIRSLTRSLTADDTTVVDSSLTRILQASRAPSQDNISISDSSLLRIVSALRLVTPDTISLSEDITTTQSQAILRTVEDSTAVTDGTLIRVLSALRVPSSETVTIADSSLVRMLQLARVVGADTIATSESISSALTTPGVFSRTASDTVTVADSSLIRLLSSARTASDTYGINESLERFVNRTRAPATDSISIADVSINRIRSLSRTPTQDTMNIVEASLIRLLSLARSASDTTVISEVQSEIAHSRALQDTISVTEPLLQRIVSAARSVNDITDITEAVFYQTYHKFVFDTVVVAEQLFSIRESLTGAVTYAIPSEVRPLLGNIGPTQRTDDQINLAIDAAYDEINTKTNRIPPNDWKDTDHNFGIVKKLTRYIAARECAIGIKDFDTKPLDVEIEHLFNDLLTFDTTSDATQDIVGSSPDVTYALNEGGIIWSTRYSNLSKKKGSENSTTINPDA